mmetsp:Transcript_3816/g.11355  ORF Transcript_3816/g.11355 Transcript_3816/m.11355 type:complete len:137 (-) Transcript_3816:99-509(-)
MQPMVAIAMIDAMPRSAPLGRLIGGGDGPLIVVIVPVLRALAMRTDNDLRMPKNCCPAVVFEQLPPRAERMKTVPATNAMFFSFSQRHWLTIPVQPPSGTRHSQVRLRQLCTLLSWHVYRSCSCLLNLRAKISIGS